MSIDAILEPTGPSREMSDEEADLASRIHDAIQASSNSSERSLQAANYRAGISDLGYCSERLRRMLNREKPGDTDVMKAFIGTALGDHVEQACRAYMEGPILTQVEVVCPLPGERGQVYNVMGHPDLIIQAEGILLDAKSAAGTQLVRRVGPDQQKQFQRHCYAKGAWLDGFFPDHDLSEIRVGNVWIDRTGEESMPYVQLEPFDDEVVSLAARWLDDVVYAYLNDLEARKEPAREVCFATCGFAPVCRELDTDVSGLLEDEEILVAVDMYVEGRDMEKVGRALKKEAGAALDGISGSTGEVTVRWISVGESTVPEFTRKAHKRLDIRPVKR